MLFNRQNDQSGGVSQLVAAVRWVHWLRELEPRFQLQGLGPGVLAGSTHQELRGLEGLDVAVLAIVALEGAGEGVRFEEAGRDLDVCWSFYQILVASWLVACLFVGSLCWLIEYFAYRLSNFQSEWLWMRWRLPIDRLCRIIGWLVLYIVASKAFVPVHSLFGSSRSVIDVLLDCWRENIQHIVRSHSIV